MRAGVEGQSASGWEVVRGGGGVAIWYEDIMSLGSILLATKPFPYLSILVLLDMLFCKGWFGVL